ncbi:hypothetical protein [Anaeromyxobacter oryzae]|uniref:Uncharacterized protein n=1 Tax=Anaeromyxobacter oryzae TaxID=2918170 RepID=A0ABM7WZ36_9BACT|nr:hypothetical protein [Anaeromyxobacter oryzae]BDG04808.1 hypothetical protein AMOR_38040 [Anaeromyxobacter oryzae]
MSRTRIALLCLPLALVGAGLAAHASRRVREEERALTALAAESQAAGRSFVETLQGEHAERQRLVFEKRRAAALGLAAARRDRLIGVLLVGAALLAAGALTVMRRIAEEVAEHRADVDAAAPERGPDRSR